MNTRTNCSLLLLVGFIVLISTVICGCGKKMNDDDYIMISNEYMKALAEKSIVIITLPQKEQEKVAKEILDKVCKKYGYTKKDYIKKAKEMGKKY